MLLIPPHSIVPLSTLPIATKQVTALGTSPEVFVRSTTTTPTVLIVPLTLP